MYQVRPCVRELSDVQYTTRVILSNHVIAASINTIGQEINYFKKVMFMLPFTKHMTHHFITQL